MAIFSKKEIDLYKGKTKVLKSVRVDKATAVKIDELQAVCIAEKGVKVSQNQILTGIITSFINEIEATAKDNEATAVSRVMAILNWVLELVTISKPKDSITRYLVDSTNQILTKLKLETIEYDEFLNLSVNNTEDLLTITVVCKSKLLVLALDDSNKKLTGGWKHY